MDSERVAALAKEFGASLVLFARQWTNDPDDALQEALMDLLRLDEAPRDAVAWLFTAVKRKAMNHLRGETRHQRHRQVFAAQRNEWFSVDLAEGLSAQEARQALESLGDAERQIVVARIWGRLSFEQIADVMNSSRSSVHRQYQTALRELSNKLDPKQSGNSIPGKVVS